jgi:carboxypeptidase PM20D1
MKRIVAALILALVAAVALVVVRGSGLASRQIQVEPIAPMEVDADAAAKRLSRAITYRTISHFDTSNLDAAAFQSFQTFLLNSYPAVHRALTREYIGESLTMLYRWQGSDPSLEPLLLLAHQDVVPVPPDTEARWSQPPWDGVIADGFVWGRGAMDDKGNLMAILEAVEALASRGFAPTRTVYLAFGHDEEVGGTGAKATAELLTSRGIRADFVVDEGMAVVDGLIPGLDRSAALIGVAEKGYCSVRLVVEQAGGHSSTPPPSTAVGILAAAIVRLEQAPMPARLDGVTRSLFDYVAPELPLGPRVAFANLWLFEWVVKRQLASSPGTNATLRTTTAATMIQGSPKDNVLPNRAEAVVNFRILPGDDVDDVVAHVNAAVGDDRVQVETLGVCSDPSPVSDPESESFALMQRTIGEVFPGAVVAPALVLGGTDARYYTGVSDDVYRFSPYRYVMSDLSRAHGIDERISIEHHADAIRFYKRLIENVQP